MRAVNPKPQAGIRTPVTGFMPFTDDARDVVVQARAEADRLGLGRPGSEQLLLALAGTGEGVAAQALKRLGISPATVRQQVTQLPGHSQPPVPPEADTPFARQVMPRAVGEAVAHGHDYIGTEHILLGLFHAGDDTAARTLTSLGAGERESEPRSSPSPAIRVQAVPRTTGATSPARVMTRSVGCEPRSPGYLTCSASTASSPTTAAGRARSRAYEAARWPASSARNRSGWSRCGPWPASSITTSR